MAVIALIVDKKCYCNQSDELAVIGIEVVYLAGFVL